ncbi:MAG: L-aspartate oxidase, partial [Acidobacteria bacterium]|nr:L-aspartate oxidase [Acidobacteriota bacterium]
MVSRSEAYPVRVSVAERFDFVVVGAGIAGLRAAMTLAKAGSVLVVTKEKMAESNTAYAQGGIAVAMGGAEDVAEHLDDTVMAGDGLVNRESAQVLVEQGPARVEELLAWGTEFDREQGELMRTREGAHSRSRILHAHGDATGWEIARSLLRMVTANSRIEVREFVTTIDLLRADTGRVCGVVLEDAQAETRVVEACAVLLASGGAGQVYSDTTNPAVATGDGIAMAWRAGAAVSDMEFYQFHPTAFSQTGAPRFLLSEALRGEGAYLRNTAGERFMSRYHKLVELAPRDVVARAITREGMAGEVYLDMRHVQKDLKARFPGISTFLSRYGFELGRDLIPVRPAAHYLMGGVRTDTHGRTSLPGLYAAGECACTGVHGANRLASNSLLEGLVFGALAAEAMVEECGGRVALKPVAPAEVKAGSDVGDIEAWIAHLRALMWEKAGLLRDAARLREAKTELEAMALPSGDGRRCVEARNLHAIALMIVTAA